MIEIVAPAGFEKYFIELADAGDRRRSTERRSGSF